MESDHELAFRLQMEEAIAASLSLLSTTPVASASFSTASTSRLNSLAVLDGNPVCVYHRPAAVRDEFEMDRRDRELSEAEVRSMPFDLSHRFRDQKPAPHDVRRLPAVKCVECGDHIQIASGEGSSSGARPLLKNVTYRMKIHN